MSAWTDRSGVGNGTQATAAERPAQTAAAINYNTALTFDGVNDNLDLIDRMAAGVTGVSAYAVAKQVNTTNDTWGSVFNGQANGPSWVGGGYGLVALNAGSTLHGFYIRDYNTKGASFAVTNGLPFLIGGNWNGTTANRVEAFKNGTSMSNVAYTPGSVGDAGSSWIGSGDGSAGNWCFYGDIAEICVFNTALSSANHNKAQSYLAVKYAITMSMNYLNSAGATIYSPTGTYVNNIIGLTRDDGSGLTQKQSRNWDDTVRIYIGALAASNAANAGTLVDDMSHVVAGADNGKMCAYGSTTTEIPGGFSLVSRLDREWKVTNTNYSGTFSMDFKLNSCAVLGSINVADLRLLIDDDGNFAAGVNNSIASGASGITISYVNPIITVSGISTALIASGATQYVTIGTVSAVTPLPVELLDFAGILNNNKVDLSWSTATEKKTDRFEVQRSIDAIDFKTIGAVQAAGNSNKVLKYSSVDGSPLNGVSYYRLKILDDDATYDYSNIISVNVIKDKNIKFIVYPNPNKGEFTADISGIENNHEVQITLKDEKGDLVYDSKFFLQDGIGKLSIIPDHKLPNGLYICTLTLEGIDYHVKVIVN